MLKPCEQFALLTFTGNRLAEISIAGWLAFTATEYGVYLPGRGTDSCLFLALGLGLRPWGWTPGTYFAQALAELTKTHVDSSKVADYRKYAAQVGGGLKIELHAVVHMGLSAHVAWLVVQCVRGEWMVVLYTYM